MKPDTPAAPATEQRFYILSLKWSREETLTWYRPEAAGYTWALEDAGIYSEAEARPHSWGRNTIAIPVAAAQSLAVRVVLDGKREELLKAAADAGFILPPESPPPPKEKYRCVHCGKYMTTHHTAVCRRCREIDR